MPGALNINEFNARLNSILNALPGEVTRMNTKIALDVIPKITNRLIDQGKTAEGKSLGKYSTRPLSPLLLIKQSSGKGAQQKVINELKKNKKAGRPTGISYERFRELNNLPTDHVTLSFTGETLGDIGVLSSGVNGTIVRITAGSRGSKSKDVYDKKGKKTGTKNTAEVLDDLDEKYGSALNTELLSLSAEEESEITAIQDQMLQNFVNKYFS